MLVNRLIKAITKNHIWNFICGISSSGEKCRDRSRAVTFISHYQYSAEPGLILHWSHREVLPEITMTEITAFIIFYRLKSIISNEALHALHIIRIFYWHYEYIILDRNFAHQFIDFGSVMQRVFAIVFLLSTSRGILFHFCASKSLSWEFTM